MTNSVNQMEYYLFQAKKFEPAKLSKHKYEEPEAELKLSDELSGNLRGLKPEGNLLADRLVNNVQPFSFQFSFVWI